MALNMNLSPDEIEKLPRYREQAKAVAGKDVLLYICKQENPREWVLIGGQQNAPITEQADSIDVSDKTGGNFGKKLAGLHNWSIDFSGLWILEDAGLKICRYLFKNDKQGFFRIEYPNGTFRQGWASVTELSDDNAHDAALTVKMTIEGYAALSDFQDAIVPNIETTTGTVTNGANTVFSLDKGDAAIRELTSSDGMELVYGQDFTLVGDALNILPAYGDALAKGTYALIAKFATESITLTLNKTTDAVKKDETASTGTGE